MSAFEPQPPDEPTVDMPEFMVVLRGYDRRQVETWARELANQIEQERQRADAAEKAMYRRQMEGASPPSFTHLGNHVASIIEEAGKSAENMLADAADRAQETIDAAEAESGEIIKAAEHRAGEIEGEARQVLDAHKAEGERVESEAREAAEEMRSQAEHDARAVLEEARDATDLIWQDAERERLATESETRRLETLRSRAYEQLGRMYGHLESVLDEVRRGIGIEPPDDEQPEEEADDEVVAVEAEPAAVAAPQEDTQRALDLDGPAAAPAARADRPAPTPAVQEPPADDEATQADAAAAGAADDDDEVDPEATQVLEPVTPAAKPAPRPGPGADQPRG